MGSGVSGGEKVILWKQETGFTEGSGIRCEEAEATVIP